MTLSVMHAKSPVLLPMIDANPSDIFLYGALFAGAVAAFCLERFMGEFGLASNLVAIVGNATCGWSWLLVRALFRRPAAQREIWPLMLVLVLVVAGAFLRFDTSDTEPLSRMINNVETLASSTLLLLATIEPLRGIGREITRNERRFRFIFAAGYATILAVAVLWIDGSPTGSVADHWRGSIKAGCAVLALVGIALAIWYRCRNPLPELSKAKQRVRATDVDGLGDRLLHLMGGEAAYALPDLRVADVARRVGQAEYKVTQCITGALGFRNFNHMANHFRIDEAKRRLSDPSLNHLPILTIALDCGFGSIGPFNRAFKAETEITPTGFRKTYRLP